MEPIRIMRAGEIDNIMWYVSESQTMAAKQMKMEKQAEMIQSKIKAQPVHSKVTDYKTARDSVVSQLLSGAKRGMIDPYGLYGGKSAASSMPLMAEMRM
jgi:hypothetical protein